MEIVKYIHHIGISAEVDRNRPFSVTFMPNFPVKAVVVDGKEGYHARMTFMVIKGGRLMQVVIGIYIFSRGLQEKEFCDRIKRLGVKATASKSFRDSLDKIMNDLSEGLLDGF